MCLLRLFCSCFECRRVAGSAARKLHVPLEIPQKVLQRRALHRRLENLRVRNLADAARLTPRGENALSVAAARGKRGEVAFRRREIPFQEVEERMPDYQRICKRHYLEPAREREVRLQREEEVPQVAAHDVVAAEAPGRLAAQVVYRHRRRIPDFHPRKEHAVAEIGFFVIAPECGAEKESADLRDLLQQRRTVPFFLSTLS